MDYFEQSEIRLLKIQAEFKVYTYTHIHARAYICDDCNETSTTNYYTNEGTAENSQTMSIVHPFELETTVLERAKNSGQIASFELGREIVNFHDVCEFIAGHFDLLAVCLVIVLGLFYRYLSHR